MKFASQWNDMAIQWEGEDLIVKLSTILRFCCDPAGGDEPPGYHRGLVVDEPQAPSDHGPWAHLLLNHRLESPRYTILPTITAVSPWDNTEPHDQVFGGSNAVNHVIVPTSVLPSLEVTTPSDLQALMAREAAINATYRFYDALRAVLHGDGPGTIIEFGQEREVKVDAAEIITPHLQEASHPHLSHNNDPHHSPSMSPLIQVCAALGVLVVVMVVLFHTHHFRRDCGTEQRALRRLAQHYHVTRDGDPDDVERHADTDVTDVTL